MTQDAPFESATKRTFATGGEMKMHSTFRLGIRLFCLSTCVLPLTSLGGGCKSTPTEDRAGVIQEVKGEATVLDVDLETRRLTLKRNDGAKFTVVCGDDVRNLPQVEAGDRVRLVYREALVARLQKPGEAMTSPAATAGAVRARPGEKPGAAVGAQVSMTVRIESVDLENHIVVFTPEGGGLQAIPVKRPEFREYIKGLKPGDRVEITYSEAIAISVEEPPTSE
jgi:hypothetical protein